MQQRIADEPQPTWMPVSIGGHNTARCPFGMAWIFADDEGVLRLAKLPVPRSELAA